MIATLTGLEGELVLIRICVEARHLEDLLEALAEVPFPLNPQIYHQPETVVEFPAYSSRVHEIEQVIETSLEPSAYVSTHLECASDHDALHPHEQTGKPVGKP